MLFVSLFLFALVLANQVCYSKYGCFSDAPPFDNPTVPLPQAPSVIGVTYRVFSRAHPTVPRIIDDSDVTKLQSSDYDGAKNTVILIHGFKGKQSLSVEAANYIYNTLQKKEWVHVDRA